MTAGGAALMAQVDAALARLTQTGRRRALAPRLFGPCQGPDVDGVLDLTHNDYLGLRSDPVLHERLVASIRELPAGAGGSRLLGGEHPVFAALEREFAAFKPAPAALYLASGYAANEAVATALARLPDVAFFSDALNHASIIDGIRLGGLPAERRQVFRHNDMDGLAAALARSPAALNCIFTESVFSMDGDRAPLGALGALARAHRGVLVVDEAHAVLCLGAGGRGLAEDAGLPPEALVTINTGGKALGVAGALVCGPAWFRDYLINVARPFIYSTAPSPWLAQALREALAYGARLDDRRAALAQRAAELRAGLAAAGFAHGPSTTHIVPVLCGDEARALALSAGLAARGVLARAIRPPTVPVGGARLRLALSSEVRPADIPRLLAALTAARAAAAEAAHD